VEKKKNIEDEEEKENLADIREDLKNYANDIRDRLKNDSQLHEKMTEKEKNIIDDSTQDVIDWLQDNPNATKSEVKK